MVEFDDIATGVFGGFDRDDEHLVPVFGGSTVLLFFRHAGDEACDVAELVGVGAAVEGGEV